jgi:hypothetical protein
MLHALFYLPEMEGAASLEKDVFLFSIGIGMTDGSFDEQTTRFFVDYEAGPLSEAYFSFAYGLSDETELRGRIEWSNLAGDSDDAVLARDGVQLIPEKNRGSGVSDIVIGFKQHMWASEFGDTELATSVGLKIPTSRGKQDLTTSGGIDGAIMLLGSQRLDNFMFHVNAGYALIGNEDVFSRNVELDDSLVYGLSAVYRWSDTLAFAAQVQGNTSVYSNETESIAALDEGPLTAHGGVRFRIGSYFIEANFGTGMNDQSSDTLAWLSWEARF